MNPKPTKKSSFSDREYADQEPSECDIAKKDDGARYLPIDVVERDLDRWTWSTQNFRYSLHKDNRGNFGFDAALELVIPWKDDDGNVTQRVLVGGCNFYIGSYAPNGHFVATAKSECVKNAASDLGRRFGRGLNKEIAPAVPEKSSEERPKRKPDPTIMKEYLEAVQNGDNTKIQTICTIYDIKTLENEY